MKPATILKRGRPKIEGKQRYTVNLLQTNVERFWAQGGNLSAFIDESLKARLKGAE